MVKQNFVVLPDSCFIFLLFTDVVDDAEDELKTTESKVRAVFEEGANFATLKNNIYLNLKIVSNFKKNHSGSPLTHF